MGVRRRANKPPLQPESADETLLLLVEHKLQPESGLVARTATEAMVGDLLFLYLVTVNSLVPGQCNQHEAQLRGDASRKSMEPSPVSSQLWKNGVILSAGGLLLAAGAEGPLLR